jgi:pimeloyl-ACP methyl ester carboxylesterase
VKEKTKMVKVDGLQFKDEHGRVVMLRGVNLGGSTKVPTTPNGGTHVRHKFYDHRAVSFVGRPFPAPTADEHFARLRQWGFNCLRFLVTWEAIEHAGPGVYDLIYLDHLQKMVAKAGEYGFYVFIDPHQDVWSRWTGGDGAPGWTLEAIGIDITKLHATGAAFLHQEHGDPCPTMQWTTNYGKLGAATLFTLFFAGQDLAPQTKVEGVSIQEYLQSHYINAIKQVALRVKDMPHVLGYDTLNEPSAGWIGVTDLRQPTGLFQQGVSPTPWQAMQAAAGLPIEAEVVSLSLQGVKTTGSERLNPEGVRLWRDGYAGVWQENGVWMLNADDEPELLRPQHFAQVHGREIAFNDDYLRPFIQRYTAEIREIHPEAIIFAEGTLEKGLPDLRDLPQIVNASHWYDAAVLFLRQFQPNFAIDTAKRRPIIGRGAIQSAFAAQIAQIKEEGAELANGPTLLGEFGIAFDLNEREGLTEGNFAAHISALDRTFKALEANLLHGTLWNYTADNDNEYGDQWNGEDLSIFSRDQFLPEPIHDPHDLDEGGRATAAFVRPYPRATAGEPLSLSFDPQTRIFEFTFRHDPALPIGDHATEIFVPDYHYSIGLGVELSDGECHYDQENQLLRYYHTAVQETHTIRLTRQRGPAELLTGEITVGDKSYPIEHHFVRTNGVTLHTVQAGPQEGDLVLLLHGFPEFWYGWREQIPFLVRQGYRVIAPDQRGYNLSDKPKDVANYHLDKLAGDIVGLLDAHGRRQAHLVGHDWGAMVAWWAAAKYPSRWHKVVILNVPHPYTFIKTLSTTPSQMAKSWYAGVLQLPILPELLLRTRDYDSLAKIIADYVGEHDTFTAEDMAQYKKAWARPNALTSMINWYRAFVRTSPRLTDPVVRVPLLLIWGARDVALGRKMARPSVDDYCEHGRVVFIEEATHWVQHDEPERVNSLLARFFAPREAEDAQA